MVRAADEERSARLKIQGPSGKGWTASITPASAASLRVFDATFRTRAASPRLSHGSACRENMSVLYTRMPRLFADLAIAQGDARYARLLRSLARVKLLILDDWGPEALTPNQARDLLEIVEDRYDKGSLIITSQVPVDRWHDLIGVPTLADAILDRVIHNAYRIELAGESLRKRHSTP